MMKNQKGITLIALVITIIVLLILAGVSIAMLTGDNGILTQANKSTVTNIEGRVEEEVRLAVQAARLTIENQLADDYSWDAVTDVKKGDNSEIVGTIKSDLTTGYTITPSADGASIEVKYAGADYTKARNLSTASITYTITVTQHKVTLSTATIV